MAKSGDDGSRDGASAVCVGGDGGRCGLCRCGGGGGVMVVVKFIPDASHLITLLRCINCESAASMLQHIKAAVGTIEAREYK